MNIFQRHNDYNYFRGEISFPPILDKYFGVQTNKSRFSIDQTIRERLEDLANPIIAQIRKIAKDFQAKSRSENTFQGVRPAEEIASKVDAELKKSSYVPSIKELKQAEATLEKEKKTEIDNINQNSDIKEEDKKELIQKIENKFQFIRPFMIELRSIPYGPFYFWEPMGKSSKVVINISHPFYTKIYEKATQSDLALYLDLLLLTLAKAESIFYHNDNIRKFYETQRTEWSTILKVYLEETPEDSE